METKFIRSLIVLGIPGVSLGIFFLLLRKFNFQFSTIDTIWASIIAIIFLLLVGAVTLYALYLWSPPRIRSINEDKSEDPHKIIRGYLIDIEKQSRGEVKRRFKTLEGYLAHINTERIKQLALQELVSLIFNDEDTANNKRKREIRNWTLDLLIKLRGRDIANLFPDDQLEDLDLYGMNFSNCNLRGVSFKGSFLVSSSFNGATLDGANFTRAYIRNVDFSKASLRNVNFTNSDWFNALGITYNQLQISDLDTLSTPPIRSALFQYLRDNYEYPFNSWEPDIKYQLEQTWESYYGQNGLISKIMDLKKDNSI